MRMSLMEELKSLLIKEEMIQAAVLFGSHAADRARPGSDPDVAIWLRELPCNRQWEDLRMQLSLMLMDRFHCAVDLVLLDTAPPSCSSRSTTRGLCCLRGI